MEDNAIINDGDQAKLVPVTLKDHSKDPVLETKRERTALEKEADAEIIAETCCAPKRKRGRPKKAATKVEIKPLKEWYCSTCRENINDLNVMRIGAGDNGRSAVFCPQCQRSFGFEDQEFHDRVAKLVRDNPTGK